MNIRLTAGTLPPNYCIPSLQDFANKLFSNAYGTLDTTASIAKVIIGSTEPNADQRDYIWIRLNPVTGAYDRTYNYINGKWVSPHAVPASSSVRQMWVGTAAELVTHDGGSSGSAGDASGPMWEIDTDFEGRFALGAGTLGSGTEVTTEGSEGGNETVKIAKANLPTDKLTVLTDIIGQGSVGSPGQPVVGSTYGSTEVSGSGRAVDSTSDGVASRYYTKGQTEAMGEGTALNIMPPYKGVHFIKRTSRKYYTPS